MEKLLPILSGSLREVIESVSKKYDCKIAKEVLKAHDFTELYNRIVDGFGGIELEYTLPYIKEIIDDLRTNAVSMLSYRQGTFEISFLPEGREPKYTSSGNWSKENRQVGKPTRIIQKLLKQEYKTRDLELFKDPHLLSSLLNESLASSKSNQITIRLSSILLTFLVAL